MPIVTSMHLAFKQIQAEEHLDPGGKTLTHPLQTFYAPNKTEVRNLKWDRNSEWVT